jgi:hypothetical protein
MGVCIALLWTGISALPAASSQVALLTATHRNGQTFLVWNSPLGIGWSYRVYRSATPLLTGEDLGTASLVGTVGDSTWCDRRLSSLVGIVQGFTIDPLGLPFDVERGLFVATPAQAGDVYYAVTCQGAGDVEDRTLVPGVNALLLPVSETPARPRPVYQRDIRLGGCKYGVYTLWTTDTGTPHFPAMSNRASQPFDCSVVLGTKGGALMFQPHPRFGNFLTGGFGSGTLGEWVLTTDDFIETTDVNTFWFGYQANYDNEVSAANPAAATGVVEDYTARRVIFTLEWARGGFAIDTTRVYAMGASMGGIGSVFMAMDRPDLIAAVMVSTPLFDFGFDSDPNPSSFNPGGSQRATCDRLWGTIASQPRLEDGTLVYDRLNAGRLARALESRFVPPIFAFNGRNDTVVGWAEKTRFYQTMDECRGGGAFFWDTRNHYNTATAGAWYPMQDYRYLYRFRTNRSFPAFSHCSGDGNPGNGEAANGDSIGTINGFLEWDPSLDVPRRWRVRLKLRNLTTLWGTVSAPESVTVDVTPRRLQSFAVSNLFGYTWTVTRTSDGATVQTGTATVDSVGQITMHGVKVYKGGSVLEVIGDPAAAPDLGTTGVGRPGWAVELAPAIGPIANPVRSAASVNLSFGRAGEAFVELFDVSGRVVRHLFRGDVAAGVQALRLDPAALPRGIYFLVARQGRATTIRRVAILP